MEACWGVLGFEFGVEVWKVGERARSVFDQNFESINVDLNKADFSVQLYRNLSANFLAF